ncbi:hypothetical protein F2Q69_00012225 [Brassica cretica]|uniref:DUF1985 domain-containing protein n=1 Tax=Brassica cretica TaxID=69181 RepID=A0A8S9R2V6_BRACR|nr:hypothetical protein F2Q69_00012225 [Brassica cretica]
MRLVVHKICSANILASPSTDTNAVTSIDSPSSPRQLPLARQTDHSSLITARKYELWYTFGTHPLRFSLDEFHSITGLNCSAFDVEYSDSEDTAGSVMWQKLFDTTVGDITVAKVLDMLCNPFLASWKRLTLALIALVDGVLCCTNKTLKLTPKYVEMLTDVPSFLNYPWGRLSFVYTLSHFLPPPVSKDIPDPLHELRIRLSQQTTVCYGFPLALQLLAFEAVPQLLDRVPDAANTSTFLEDPSACYRTLQPPPGSGAPHVVGRGRRLARKQPENAPLPPEYKFEVVPIIQRNLHPRKPTAVVVEDLTSSEHNEPERDLRAKYPHAYKSGKIAPVSETPPSTAYLDSDPHLPSTRTAADVETLSRDVSATKTQPAAVTEGAARDSMAGGNERSPVEEKENYESFQENISIDTRLQEKHPVAVETLPRSDMDEDDNSVESGGKRLRKKSQKIRGVYTPDARLKGVFMSEKKTEYRPLPKRSRAIFKKFSDILSENLVKQFEIKTSHIVMNSFFVDIATPRKWLSDEYVGYTVYQISEGVRFFSWNRVESIYHNKRGGDCAPCAVKFMEMHLNGDGKEEMSLITCRVVDKIREQYAMDCYEEFVGDYRVANEACMK